MQQLRNHLLQLKQLLLHNKFFIFSNFCSIFLEIFLLSESQVKMDERISISKISLKKVGCRNHLLQLQQKQSLLHNNFFIFLKNFQKLFSNIIFISIIFILISINKIILFYLISWRITKSCRYGLFCNYKTLKACFTFQI